MKFNDKYMDEMDPNMNQQTFYIKMKFLMKMKKLIKMKNP